MNLETRIWRPESQSRRARHLDAGGGEAQFRISLERRRGHRWRLDFHRLLRGRQFQERQPARTDDILLLARARATVQQLLGDHCVRAVEHNLSL